MKRTIIIFFTTVIVLFSAISLLKNYSSETNQEISSEGKSSAEKEKIRQFWKFHREAKRLRLAGKIPEAIAAYRKAIQLNGKHEGSLYHLGNMYVELAKYDSAEIAWKRLIQVNPISARVHFQLGDLYLSYDQQEFYNTDAAEAQYMRALEINKEETAPLLRLGQVALIKGNFDEAQRRFNSLIASNFKSVEAHFLNGFIAWKQKNSNRARTSFEKAVKFSRPQKTAKGMSGEGDTKKGEGFGLHESSRHQSIFHFLIRDLKTLDEKSLSLQMDQKYQKLDAFLKKIKEK